jgi:GGDEF domain-containing protein
MSLVYMLDAEAAGADRPTASAAATELERMLTDQGRSAMPAPQPPPAPAFRDVQPEARPRPAQPAPLTSTPAPLRATPAPVRTRPTVVPLPVRRVAPEPVRQAPPPQSPHPRWLPARPTAPHQEVAAAVPTAPRPRAVPTAPHREVAAATAAPRSLAPSTLVDEVTGIGGPLALRRDVMLESSLPWPGGPRFALITIDVQPVAEVRQRRGEQVADRLFKTLVDALQASLRPKDNIYRSGPDELTLLLRGRDPNGDQARVELESALRTALAERGLPLVRLATATKRPRPATVERQAAAV